MNDLAASSGVSSSLLGRHSVLDTESSRAFWIPAFAGMTNSRQAAGNGPQAIQTDGQTKETVVKQEDAEADIIQPCGKTERRVDIPYSEARVSSKGIHMLPDRRSVFARRVIVKLQNAI